LARDNYSYQRYQRDLAKKKKKEEKMLRKLNKKKDQDSQPAEGPSNQNGGVEVPDSAVSPDSENL
jgi:hypothetical protein